MTKAVVLRKYASETGLHPSDLLMEVNYVTGVAATSGTIPTGFADGTIVAILCSFQVLTTMTTTMKIPFTVSSGAVTWTTSAALLTSDKFSVLIIARPTV